MNDSNFYASDRAVSEYLLFHYGSPAEVLPWSFGPGAALNFPVRCISDGLDQARLPAPSRALDLGCAVGRSTFELARHCAEVIGLDASPRFIEVARQLQRHGSLPYAHVEEGLLVAQATAIVPPEIERGRVRFETGDAQAPGAALGRFDAVLMANLVDRLADPRRCLASLPELVAPGGQLIVTTPCTWLDEYTPREQWLGGFDRGGHTVRTLDGLRETLEPHFDLDWTGDLPFLIREHARKYQWSVAQATRWIRRA